MLISLSLPVTFILLYRKLACQVFFLKKVKINENKGVKMEKDEAESLIIQSLSPNLTSLELMAIKKLVSRVYERGFEIKEKPKIYKQNLFMPYKLNSK